MWHGAAHIAGLYPDRSAAHDFLTYGAGLVKSIGFDTIKLELSIAYNTTKYPYQTFGTATSLVTLAQQTAFDDVFSDAGFARYWLSCFSLVQSTDNLWGRQWTTAIGDAVEQEFYDLCVHLRSYSNKEFILANWEGDWQLLQSFNPVASIGRGTLYGYRDFCRRRQRALTKARADTPSSTSTILYSIECNRVLDGWGPRVHRDVVPNVRPDMVSLSAYEAIEGWQQGLTQLQLEADIEDKLERSMARVRAVHAGPVAISEFGWPIDNPGFVSGGYDVGALLDVAIAKAAQLGMVGEIYWQILDNEQQAPGVPYGFGLYGRNGNSTTVGPLTASGEFYQSFL